MQIQEDTRSVIIDKLNLKYMQIPKLSYDVDLSNFSMFEMKRFGSGNKQDITKINPNPLLCQG